jgi:YD repeat-containing protein
VVWSRIYDSLRSAGAGYIEGDGTYECSDYGVGWSQSYAYTYKMAGFFNSLSPLNTFAMLHTITVPSPTGSGTSTDTIDYDSTTGCVSTFADANGNKHVYYSSDASGNPEANSDYTTVQIYNSGGTLEYQYTVGYDNNMSETYATNGSADAIFTGNYDDPNDPYRTSYVEDGNGNLWDYSWDSAGNMLTETTPRGVTYRNTYSDANFALGELVQTQEVWATPETPTPPPTMFKTPANFTYYEPSGLLETLAAPTPGTVDTGSQVTTSFTYDSLGNVLTMTTPGNNSVGSKLTTLNYTSDPGDSPHGVSSHSQSDAIGQPPDRDR